MNQLSAAERWLLFRATVTLACASAAVALLPFKWAIGYGCIRLEGSAASLAVGDCVWAVGVAARRVPWRAMCFEQGLCVQRLLRKRGIDAVLHYGAHHNNLSGKLEAHVWVTVAGEAVIGGEEALGHHEIATFP